MAARAGAPDRAQGHESSDEGDEDDDDGEAGMYSEEDLVLVMEFAGACY